MQYVVAAFVVLVSVYVVSKFLRDRRRAPRLEKAAGTVLDRRVVGRTTTSQAKGQALYEVSVQFRTATGDEVSGRAKGQYRDHQVGAVGQAVDVWYDRLRPTFFQLIPPGSLVAAWPFFLVLAVICTVAVAVVVL
jgi:hypothetical protein